MDRKQKLQKERSIDIVIPVKNGGDTLVHNVEKWIKQDLAHNWEMYVYIVDDGSTDGAIALIESKFSSSTRVSVLYNPSSQGRARACNQGAHAGRGEFVAFFDADCEPKSKSTIKEFINVIESCESKLLFGSLEGTRNDFWGRYFQEVSNKREKMYLGGDKAAFTTANCVIERSLFCQVGGFDENFTKYGFEDKDLILRLLSVHNTVSYVKEAKVLHNDQLSLGSVCEKMRIAGEDSSLIFQKKHPDTYKNMSFYKADMRNKPKFLASLFLTLRVLKSPIMFFANCLLISPVPYFIKAKIVLYCSGVFFAIGTSENRLS